jgi:tetratricopeptide (TPR) repeat protein
LDTVLFDKYKKNADIYLKDRQFSEALEFYEKCLKITRKATTIENIAVYVNKIACLLSLEKHEKVVQECNDALRLIKNFRNKFDQK